MEFEKFGGVAEMLAEKEEERRSVFPRGGEKNRAGKFVEETPPEPDFELFDLLTALKEVLKSAPKEATHKVEILNVTSEMKQREILDALERECEIDFVAYVKGRPKIIIVVTFIAMLELIKLRKIRVRQSGQFKRIVIVKRDITDEPPVVMDDTGDLNGDDVNYTDANGGGFDGDGGESTEP